MTLEIEATQSLKKMRLLWIQSRAIVRIYLRPGRRQVDCLYLGIELIADSESSAHAYYIPTTAWCGSESSNVAYIYIGATIDVGKDNEVG